jgi:hypothetical protein
MQLVPIEGVKPRVYQGKNWYLKKGKAPIAQPGKSNHNLGLSVDVSEASGERLAFMAETAALWRQRGTIPGLTRLLSILAEAPVQVIEAFRLRRETSAILGAADWGVLGPGLQLGGEEGPEPVSGEPWEQKLQQEHLALMLRRMAVRAEGDTPCPEADPSMPLDPDPVIAFASGWMNIRQRAKAGGIELPLILSDHADWDELTQTVTEVNPEELWVTHGRDDALARWAELNGRKARPLHLIGYEDEAGE